MVLVRAENVWKYAGEYGGDVVGGNVCVGGGGLSDGVVGVGVIGLFGRAGWSMRDDRLP